ncbi:hypothetical protein POTOM_034878 [Populus tomentosa]|uniref:CASP-like protein n=1 Tax=Populus tomentosa TaxID=118781 RepID=A0A8X8CPJ1_POPTO|nr:hypothetical protein POTOM_034878 [Populus tomentosa]
MPSRDKSLMRRDCLCELGLIGDVNEGLGSARKVVKDGNRYPRVSYKISSIVEIPTETRAVAKGTAHLKGAYTHEKVEYKGLVIFDFVLRLGAVIAALPAAATMGTSDQTLPFTQFFEFQASYDDLPTSQ